MPTLPGEEAQHVLAPAVDALGQAVVVLTGCQLSTVPATGSALEGGLSPAKGPVID